MGNVTDFLKGYINAFIIPTAIRKRTSTEPIEEQNDSNIEFDYAGMAGLMTAYMTALTGSMISFISGKEIISVGFAATPFITNGISYFYEKYRKIGELEDRVSDLENKIKNN